MAPRPPARGLGWTTAGADGSGGAVDDADRGDLGGDRRDRRAIGLGPASAIDRPIAAGAVHRGRVDRAVGRDPHGVDLAERRVEQHERLARGVEPEDAAGRLRAGDQIAGWRNRERDDVGRAGLVEGRADAGRRDLVDHALVAGGREDVAGAIDDQRPDVLVVGVEEDPSTFRPARPDKSCRRARWRRRARRRAPARSRAPRARRSRRTSTSCRRGRPGRPCLRSPIRRRACRRAARGRSTGTARRSRRAAPATDRGRRGRRCRSTGPRRRP